MKKSTLKKIVYTFVLFVVVQLFCSYKVSATTNSVPVNKEETLFSANAETAARLIKAGADVNTRDEYGRTPLFSANVEKAEVLIKAGADVNARDYKGNTPLHFAKDGESIKLLVENGADINAQDNEGWTALMIAKENRGRHIARRGFITSEWIPFSLYDNLIELGADATIKNNQGQTVESIITRSNVRKPILYFYPPEEIQVNVVLKNEQALTHTYPKYSQSWNVLAKPDGSLYDVNGRYYYALYWEGAEENKPEPEDGFIVKGSDTISFLEEKLPLLGLNEREMNEFIIYWLPKLEQDGYNLIRFATMEEQNEYMPLEITPKPDTLIRVKMEFWHLDDRKNVTEQVLPPTPERKGFVVVEWGGVDR